MACVDRSDCCDVSVDTATVCFIHVDDRALCAISSIFELNLLLRECLPDHPKDELFVLMTSKTSSKVLVLADLAHVHQCIACKDEVQLRPCGPRCAVSNLWSWHVPEA